jgi:hypothetical protein
MSDASEWIVIPTHREFPSTLQFVPVESVMRGSLWRVLGRFCALAGILCEHPADGCGLLFLPGCSNLGASQ